MTTKSLTIKIKGTGSGIYLLRKQGIVVYVGRSENVLCRFAGHAKKEFDEIEIIWCKPHKCAVLESELIREFRPKLNIMLLKRPTYPRRFKSVYQKKFDALQIGGNMEFEDSGFYRLFKERAQALGFEIKTKRNRRTMKIVVTRTV